MTVPGLDVLDRTSVEYVRELLAKAEAVDYGHATNLELVRVIGRLQVGVEILLRVIDGMGAR